MPRGIPNKPAEATVVADVTETFENPISGQIETKIGSQLIIDNIDMKIDLTSEHNKPRYNDDEIIDYIAWDSGKGSGARGTYNLNKLLNELSIVVGSKEKITYNKQEQTIHVIGRFNTAECLNIHQPPQNIIRAVTNVMRLTGNAETERRGLYGGY